MLYGVYVVNWGHDEGGKSGQGWNCCALPGDSVITTRRHRWGRKHMDLFRVLF